MQIRNFTPEDWPAVWAILEPVFRAGDTHGVPQEISADEARVYWTGEPKSAFVASAMCEHSQAEAVRRGYRAMQFNLVVSSNDGAVRLWQKHGFDIAGTLPGAFRHPTLGFVDAFVMFKQLAGGAVPPGGKSRET